MITRPEDSYRLWWVVVCDLETWWMRRPWPALGRSATKKRVYWNLLTLYSLCETLWKCLSTLLNSFVHNFSQYVYFFSLHVSGDHVRIIRKNDCIYATLGTCYSVRMTVWCAWWMFHPAYQTVIHTEWQTPSVAELQLFLLMMGT